MKASDLPVGRNEPTHAIRQKDFHEHGEQAYVWDLSPAGIRFLVQRIRRTHGETWGEVTVSVNGKFPTAKTVDGILSSQNFNFTSGQARTTLAKTLSHRSDAPDLDWEGFLNEFAIRVLGAERMGQPAVVLADVPRVLDDKDTWDAGLPVLQRHPMVVFGDSDSGKSYLAMWMAGTLASRGIPVLYADWEFSGSDHRDRLERLFVPMPRTLHYAYCDRPLKDEWERLARLIRELGCQYIVCDSMGFAIDGRLEDSEQATSYFRAARQFKVGSCHLAHTAKANEDKEETIFGSAFFKAGARSVWFIQRADQNPPGCFQVGLYHRKHNVGEKVLPRGFRFRFAEDRTLVESISVEAIDELAAKLPMLERVQKALKHGALSPKQLATDLGTTVPAIHHVIARHTSSFMHLGGKIGLAAGDLDF